MNLFKIERLALTHDLETSIILKEVYEGLENKDYFALGNESHLEKDGYLYKAYFNLTGELASVFALLFPHLTEENLGYDIALDKEELEYVAIADVAATRERYRGNKLQQRLMMAGEEDLRVLGYRYIMCTIHPDNEPSLNTALGLGYQIMVTKTMYGGLIRHILMKKLK